MSSEKSSLLTYRLVIVHCNSSHKTPIMTKIVKPNYELVLYQNQIFYEKDEFHIFIAKPHFCGMSNAR